MRFHCKLGGNLKKSQCVCTVGKDTIEITRSDWWQAFQNKLNWRWLNGANCELLIPNGSTLGDYNWYIHVDGVRVCSGILKGSFPDWWMRREWKCDQCELTEGRLQLSRTFQCIKIAGEGVLVGVWRNCGTSTHGVIRDDCEETVRIAAFGIMLSQRVAD
ncbi:MAG: hypothetical protein JWN70_6961 [Planctomycetaceae bacterium]|nr:hypothetical protein [Planctomycetaceae bacterium]